MEILQNLNISLPAFLVNFIGFGLLVAVANKMVFIPIGKVIEERQVEIQDKYEQLDADQQEMQVLKADYEARLGAIEAEGRERINNMIKEAQATRDSVLSDANSRAQQLVSSAEAEVAREKEQALITLRAQVTDLAIGAAERVIGESMNDERSRRLVDEFITTTGGDIPDYATTTVVPTPVATAPVAETPAAPAPWESAPVEMPTVIDTPVAVETPVLSEAPVVAPVSEAVLSETADDAVTLAKRPRVVRKKATDATTEEGAA